MNSVLSALVSVGVVNAHLANIEPELMTGKQAAPEDDWSLDHPRHIFDGTVWHAQVYQGYLGRRDVDVLDFTIHPSDLADPNEYLWLPSGGVVTPRELYFRMATYSCPAYRHAQPVFAVVGEPGSMPETNPIPDDVRVPFDLPTDKDIYFVDYPYVAKEERGIFALSFTRSAQFLVKGHTACCVTTPPSCGACDDTWTYRQPISNMAAGDYQILAWERSGRKIDYRMSIGTIEVESRDGGVVLCTEPVGVDHDSMSFTGCDKVEQPFYGWTALVSWPLPYLRDQKLATRRCPYTECYSDSQCWNGQTCDRRSRQCVGGDDDGDDCDHDHDHDHDE